MKRVLALLLLLAACASESVEAPPPVPANWKAINAPPPAPTVQGPTAKERAIAEAYVAALTSQNLAGMALLFDEIGHMAFGSHDVRGRERVAELHQQLFGAFDDRKAATVRVWHADDRQIVEWVMTGTQARPWMGIAPTQKSVVIRGLAFLWTQDQGTVSDEHLYFSVPVVKAQLGVGPKELIDYLATVPPPPPSSPALDEENSDREKDNEKVVRKRLDDFEQNKEADFLAAYADDVKVETLDHAPTTKKADIATYYQTMHHVIGHLDTTIISLQPVNRFVLLEYFISGEQYGPIGLTPMPPPPEHAAYVQIAEVVELTDDHKIDHIWRYSNPDWQPPQP